MHHKKFLQFLEKMDGKEVKNCHLLPSKPHPFVAGIADFYFLGLVLGTVLAIVLSGLNKIFPIVGVLFLFLTVIIAPIIYHRKLAKKTLWLSPGELFAGKVVGGW